LINPQHVSMNDVRIVRLAGHRLKIAQIGELFEVDDRNPETDLIKTRSIREEVLTDTIAAHGKNAAGNKKGLGHAIDSDDSRSSTWLRTKNFQRHGLRGHHWFGWFRSESDAGILGRPSVSANVWSYGHDAAADRHRAERSAIGR
jgi:hypothetical protein